ncbi:MAG: amidohydrolase family protein [Longimicrobiales bacterium]
MTVSPDGSRVAFRRNGEIWVAPLGGGGVVEDPAVRLSDDGGLNYSFSPDSRAVVYATGEGVWSHPVNGGARTPIAVDVDLPVVAPVTTLIRGVRVLDFEVDGFTDPTSILVADGRIEWIGPESGRTVPSGARILDAEGRFAIPGLFDSHTHVATPIHFNPARDVSRMESNLAYGVTSVRDMGSDITLVKAWTDRREHFGAPVPRIFSYGAMTEVPGPFFHGGSWFVGTEDEARAMVREQKADGTAGIKSYFTMPWPLQRATADESRRQGMPVAAHGLTFREVVMAPVLGRTSMEHQPSPIRVHGDILRLLAETGVRWDPTVAPVGGNGVLFAQEPELLSDPKLRSFTSQGDYALAGEVELFAALDPQVLGQAYADLLTSLGQGHAMGVSLLAGTDALNPNVFYGHGLHTELWHLSRARIPAIDILRIATIEAATTVGAQDHLGSLEAGKLADIVLLDEDPLEDIRHAESIWQVMLEGRLYGSDPELARR